MTGIKSSMAPVRFISSRTMFSTFRSTRRPIGIHVYRPDALALIRPARSMSLWLGNAASAGASLRVEMKNWEAFIVGFSVFCKNE